MTTGGQVCKAAGVGLAAVLAAFGVPQVAAAHDHMAMPQTRLALGDSGLRLGIEPPPESTREAQANRPWSLTLDRPVTPTLSLGVGSTFGSAGTGIGPAARLDFDDGLSLEALSTYVPPATAESSGRVDLRVDVTPAGRLPALSFSGGAAGLRSENPDYSASAGLRLRF